MTPHAVVSVVIPVYNTKEYLPACLNSILNQTIGPDKLEIIIVDDGSTDGSLEYLKEFAANNENVKLFCLPQNTGDIGYVRNVGLKAATGEWLYCVDSDDWLGAEALERLVKHAEDWGSDVIQGKMMNVDGPENKGRFSYFSSNNPSITEGVLTEDKEISATVGPMRLIKRELLKKNRILFPEGLWYEDAIFILEVLFAAERISIANDYEYYFVRRDTLRKGGLSKAVTMTPVKRPDRIVTAIRKLFDIIDEHSGELLEHLLIIKKLFSYQMEQAFLNIEAYAEQFPELYPDKGLRFEQQVWERISRYYTPELRAVLPIHKAVLWDYAQKGFYKQADITVLQFCNAKPVTPVKLIWNSGIGICKSAPRLPGLDILNADTWERLRRISMKAVVFCITDIEYIGNLKLLLKGTYEFPLLITSEPEIYPVLQFGDTVIQAESTEVKEDVWGEPFQGRGRWGAVFCIKGLENDQKKTVKTGLCFDCDGENVAVIRSFRDNRFPERIFAVDILEESSDGKNVMSHGNKLMIELGELIDKTSAEQQLKKAKKEIKQTKLEIKQTKLEKKELGKELEKTKRELKAVTKKANNAQKELKNIKESKSWKVTKPLRSMGRFIHKILDQGT